jgi:hypothetical protein
MKLKALASTKNLSLAWRRITTGTNEQYKRHYRTVYLAYEVCADQHLKELRERILGGTFVATPPERIYLPKPSGLHRPLTLLGLEDQIVYQAFANLAADKVHSKRQLLELDSVFSNVLAGPTEIFFFRSWRTTYAAFQQKVRTQFDAGMHWVADFDLAAYYDTISHQLLLKEIYPRAHDDEDVKWFLRCLTTWTSTAPARNHGHGLPQGPLASDFLAECFLLPIDSQMASSGYVRYVDDIRLMGKSENDVRERVIDLEKQCRERGLIPQSGKFAIKRATTVREALGMLPSLSDPHDRTPAQDGLLTRRRARQLFRKSLGGRPLRIKDKTYARYSLFRAPPSAPLLRQVLKLVPHQPEFADAFFTFLARFGPNESILTACERLVRASPYAYVRGESWQVLASGMLSRTLVGRRAAELVKLAIGHAKDKKRDFYERMGSCQFLCAAENVTGARYCRFLNYQPPLLQAFLASRLPDSTLSADGVGPKYFKRTAIEPGLALALRLQAGGAPFGALGVGNSALQTPVLRTLISLGLVAPLAGSTRTDPLATLLHARFETPAKKSWKPLLGAEYGHALGHLKTAEAAFDQNPSAWLQHQNNFNQIVFIALQEHFASADAPGVVTVKNKDGHLVDFGVTLDRNNKFSKHHAAIADSFREVNDRRNRLPASHAYERKTGARTKFLGRPERNRFVGLLKKAYADLALLAP